MPTAWPFQIAAQPFFNPSASVFSAAVAKPVQNWLQAHVLACRVRILSSRPHEINHNLFISFLLSQDAQAMLHIRALRQR
jgi:ABC-type Fe3+ transport system substrate-binding protein